MGAGLKARHPKERSVRGISAKISFFRVRESDHATGLGGGCGALKRQRLDVKDWHLGTEDKCAFDPPVTALVQHRQFTSTYSQPCFSQQLANLL